MNTLLDNQQSVQQQPTSFVNVTFVAPGSVQFDINMSGIHPLQLVALAKFLEFQAESTLEEYRKQTAIQVATANDLKQLR